MDCPYKQSVHHGFLPNPWTTVHGLLLNYLKSWTFHGLFMDCPWTKLVNLAEIPHQQYYPWSLLDSPWTVPWRSMDFMDGTVDCVA